MSGRITDLFNFLSPIDSTVALFFGTAPIEELEAKYESELSAINAQRKEVVRQAKSESKQMLEQANAMIENTIRKIKEAQAEKEKTKEIRKEFERFKSENSDEANVSENSIDKKIAKLREKQQQKGQTAQSKELAALKIGDNVRIKGQNGAGEIIELQGKNAVVAFGMLKTSVKVDKLERVSKTQIKKEMKRSSFVSVDTTEDIRQRSLNFKREIDVRGMRGDEALQAVQYFVDDALILSVDRIRILHGTGTGALRQIIREYLNTVHGVSSFHDEHVQFGGAGITVVEF